MGNDLQKVLRKTSTIGSINFKKDFDFLFEMKNELTIQFQNITHDLKPDVDRLSLGTSGIYLNSILSNLRGVELVLEHGLIECGATVATS